MIGANKESIVVLVLCVLVFQVASTQFPTRTPDQPAVFVADVEIAPDEIKISSPGAAEQDPSQQ